MPAPPIVVQASSLLVPLQPKQAGSLHYKNARIMSTQDHRNNAKTSAPRDILRDSDPPLTAGSCVLRRPEAAAIVQNAMCHFNGERYRLAAWCVMPNHVHAVFQPISDFKVKDILHSWKSFTANEINALLGLTGPLWEMESFDHLIRSPEDLDRFIEYTEQNPVAAGFVTAANDWPYSSAGIAWEKAEVEFVDPRTTPFENPRSRRTLPHLHKEGGTYFVTFRLFDAVELKRL
jgi:REP element-mobilizing transposase RayT